MPCTGVHLPGFIESTRRFCSVISEWLCCLIYGHFADLPKHPSSISNFKSIKKRKLHSSALSDKMEVETIDISSSDSDFDVDDYAEISSSSDDEPVAPAPPTGRVLPNWRPTSHSTGLHTQHPKLPLPIGGPNSSRGTLSLGGHQSQAGPAPSTSYGTDRRASSSHVFRGFEENGSTSHLKRDYENLRSNNFMPENGLLSHKRALPSSFNLSAGARSKQNSSWDNFGGYRGGDNSGSYHSVGPSVSNSKNPARGSFNRDWDNDVRIFERNEHHNSRILPHSLTRGKPVSSTPYVSPSDPLQNMGYAEERVTGDERLIFQAALQDLSQPKVELDLPVGVLTIPLLRHQKIALAWMVQKESRTMHCLGGILADDQGLGKTISTIALIQKQRSLQMKFQSEENDNHNTEALNLDDDDDDDKGSGSLKATNKTEEVGSDKPETLNLDDDDDDGSASSDAVKKAEEHAGSKRSSGASSSRQKFQRQRPAAGTLIMCPATVLRQWARELDDKVSEEAKLSVLVYHGGNRTKDPVELAKYDVVLTTYSIVSNEVPKQPMVDEDDVDQKLGEKYGVSPEFSVNKKRKNPSGSSKKGKKGKNLADSLFSQAGALARVSWFRVVLDEAQTIKNHRTQTARACCGLRAKRRWCLSGTPIQNSIDELYSYFRFLRHHLYSNYKTFCEGIKYPISRDPNMGYKKLQAVLKTLLLRRTKETSIDGEPIISLPPKHVAMKRVNFSSEERTFYAQLEAESRSQFKAYAAAGTVNQNYANILLMILRLRQACDHPLLVKGFCSVSGRRTNLDKARKLPRNLLMELLNQLEAASSICLICSDPTEDAVVSMCRHVFCYQCVADYLTGDDNMCPARRCKKQLSDDVLFSEATLRSCLSCDADGNLLNDDGSAKSTSILSSEYSSSKVKAAMEILLSHCEINAPYIELDGLDEMGIENSMHAQVRTHKMEGSSSGPIKTIVFSQWTRMLDLFEFSLNQYSIQYRRLDGSMSLVARDRAVREFNSDTEVTVMLMSLKAGNLGLNMVAASHVILLDLWWNPTTEDQAIDRAHRIGQTRAVTVSRITIKDTVEDRILALQEEKRKMVASAFGEDHVGGSASRLTIDDLRYLFLGSRAA